MGHGADPGAAVASGHVTGIDIGSRRGRRSRLGGIGGPTRREADGLDAGGGAADHARQFEVEEGGVEHGRWEVGRCRQAAWGEELAIDQGREDHSGGSFQTGPGRDAGGAVGHGGAELLEDVGEAANEGGAVANELVAAGGSRIPGRAREDEDTADAAAAGRSGR
jgi:hypothetical protein